MAAAAPQTYRKNADLRRAGYIPALDGVRGLAILAVLMTHSVPRVSSEGLGHWWNQLIETGSFGVDLFFVLSGFLITGTLLDSTGKEGYFRNFFARRFLRLFPVYYLYLALLALLLPPLHRLIHLHMPGYEGNWLWYLFYVSNLKPGHAAGDAGLGHFWSLAVEEQFYLCWPVVVLLGRRRLALSCLFAIALAVALRIYLSINGFDWNTLYRVTPMRIDSLALGSLAALALRSDRWRGRARVWAGKSLFAGFVLFLACVLQGRSTSWESQPVQTLGAFFLAIAFVSLVYLAATGDSLVVRIFSRPWLRSFGKYSYTIYVVHILIANYVFWVAAAAVRATGPWPYAVQLISPLVVIGLSYGIAAFSWKYYENPILRLKQRFGGSSVSVS